MIKNWRKKVHPILENQKSMQWLYMLISCVSNARLHTSEEGKIAWQLWMKQMLVEPSKLNSLSVQTVVKYQYKIAQNTEKTSLNLNANFVVASLNGFAGVILIFASHVINGSAMEIMWANIPRINYRNVRDQENVRSEATTPEMETKRWWDVQFVET